MKRFLPAILTAAMLVFSAGTAFSQTLPDAATPGDTNVDDRDDEGIGRVARLSFFDGDVSFLRAGVTEWSSVAQNLPLLAGDQVYAGPGARAEIQLSRGSYIRLSENTALTISSLSESAAQFEITEGVAIVRVERLAAGFQRFEIDTPNSVLTLRSDGLYRINVTSGDVSELIVRTGAAEVATDDGNFRVQAGFRLLVDTSTNERLEIAADTLRDDWDRWSYDRDNSIDNSTIAASPDYVNSYETSSSAFYGASDLASYGTWTDSPSYGRCWVPRVSAGWAPYRFGQWIWIPSAGWTWLSSEPWGWAPYHYGRWSFVNGLGWAWVPGWRGTYQPTGYWDYRWRPALVRFYHTPTPNGNYVAWHPLAPRERWHRPDWYGRHGSDVHPQPARNGSRRPDERRWIEPRPSERGTSILPVEGFNRSNRSSVRPVAPNQEVTGWLNRGAQPGLPQFKPTPIAAVPVLGNGDARSRRVAIPPGEVLNRPVVARNPVPDSQLEGASHRERRILPPRAPEVITDEDLLRKRAARAARRENESTGNTASSPLRPGDSHDAATPRIKLPQTPQDTSGADAEKARRRESRREQSGAATRENGNNSGDSNRQRNSESHQPFPAPSTGQQNSRPNSDDGNSRSRRRDDSSGASQPQPKPPERTENREQVHQERQAERRQEREAQHEQKREERRQEREQQPKKP